MDKINREQLMNFCIASLVSADSNFNNDERKANVKALKKLIKRDKDMLTAHQLSLAKKSIKLLKKEIRENFWKDRRYKKLIKEEYKMTQKLRENAFTRFKENAKVENMDKMVECLGNFFDEAYFQDDLSGQTFDDVVAKVHEIDPKADAVAAAKVFFESVKAEKNA